ncbi:MAG: hydroxylamine reductase, partial [Spirochaetia bacterium]|nr:hydroxylamine reductase [Spirochaetia bacterium]
MDNKMFCFQCQETARNFGCTQVGVCGKQPETSNLMDLMIWVTKGLSQVTTRLRAEGKQVGKDVNHIVSYNLFQTITNANFDDEKVVERILLTIATKESLLPSLSNKEGLSEAALYNNTDASTYAEFSKQVGVLSETNEDARSLKELITYGLKGVSAYSKHANNLIQDNEELDAFIQKALADILEEKSVDELVALTLETGKWGVAGMALLDGANTGAYGNPEMTRVKLGVGKNPGILISGHDLRDLEMLLEQTQGTGVDVYTHSEMLPAHYYPAFKKYPNFYGNYGNAWWMQKKEFESFNGPI